MLWTGDDESHPMGQGVRRFSFGGVIWLQSFNPTVEVEDSRRRGVKKNNMK